MRREELFFEMPAELIAQQPAEPRDHCRLMIVDPATESIVHKYFFDVLDFVRSGDVLVFNQSKVLPARLRAKKTTGGEVEIVLLRDRGAGRWHCLVGGKIKAGQQVLITENLQAVAEEAEGDGWVLRFNLVGADFHRVIEQVGVMPTPPYIKAAVENPASYQTVFAKDPGSAAAPTAGLHFTPDLLKRLAQKGVQLEHVTLHVGLGTFKPVKAKTLAEHVMHSEWFSVPQTTWQRIKQAKIEGRRIIAVGSTALRVLETLPTLPVLPAPPEATISGETDILITPGYQCKTVDALITNFHTPYSTLLALVYAFGGTELIRRAYQEAINQKYRFFSFGDAMFITSAARK